ncbi:MAG: trypsin-like peptidase domain-containing protein, partial [Nitrospiria bacterium]
QMKPLKIKKKTMTKQIIILSVLIIQVGMLSGCFRRIAPEGIGPTDLEEGLIAYDQGDWETALWHLDKATNNNPDEAEAFFKRGVIFQRMEKIDEAISNYREVVRIDRKHFKAHYNLANLYSYEKADTVQAVFHYRRFLKMAPGHPLASKAKSKLAQLTQIAGESRKPFHRPAADPQTIAQASIVAGELVQPPISPLPLLPKPSSEKPIQSGVFPQVVCITGRVGQRQVEGSGFVVAKGGYILASGHQVQRATRLMAHFQDGSTFPATLLSVSEALDLALLQIPFQEMTPLGFDPEKSPPVGEPVLAVGCPFGLNHSASQGIISAPERNMDGQYLLQTDVAINPGSSGGPLLSREGEVLGVVVGMLTQAQGIAFALPARDARHFLGETFLQIGNLYAEAKRYEEAADALLTSSNFWPESPQALNNLGEVYRRIRLYDAAETAYLRAVLSNPRYADAHYNLGILYDNHLNKRKQAVTHYRKYLELKPGSPDAVQVGQWLTAAESD